MDIKKATTGKTTLCMHRLSVSYSIVSDHMLILFKLQTYSLSIEPFNEKQLIHW